MSKSGFDISDIILLQTKSLVSLKIIRQRETGGNVEHVSPLQRESTDGGNPAS